MKRLLLLGSLAIALAIIPFLWHIAVFRFEMQDLRASMAALTSELRSSISRLKATDVDPFLAGLRQTNQGQERIQKMESRRQQSVSDATWLQRALGDPITDTWKDPILADLDTAYRELPALFARQTRRLAEGIETSAQRGAPNSEVRELAVEYKARRKALRAATRDAEDAGRQLLGAKIAISSSVSADRRAQEIEDWIDRSAAAEKAAWQEIERAVEMAISAADQASRVDLDASSREIQPVLESWQRAAEKAHLAQDGLSLGIPPKGLEPLIRALLESAERTIKEAVDEIDYSVARVDAVYQVALREEGTPLGPTIRGGRHLLQKAVGGPRGLGTASGQQFQRLSAEITTAADQCLSMAISSARTPAGR